MSPDARVNGPEDIAAAFEALARVQRHRLDAIADFRRLTIRLTVGVVLVCFALGGSALVMAALREPPMRWVMLAGAGLNAGTIALSLWTLAGNLQAAALDALAARCALAQVEAYARAYAEDRARTAKTLTPVQPTENGSA